MQRLTDLDLQLSLNDLDDSSTNLSQQDTLKYAKIVKKKQCWNDIMLRPEVTLVSSGYFCFTLAKWDDDDNDDHHTKTHTNNCMYIHSFSFNEP